MQGELDVAEQSNIFCPNNKVWCMYMFFFHMLLFSTAYNYFDCSGYFAIWTNIVYAVFFNQYLISNEIHCVIWCMWYNVSSQLIKQVNKKNIDASRRVGWERILYLKSETQTPDYNAWF